MTEKSTSELSLGSKKFFIKTKLEHSAMLLSGEKSSEGLLLL